MGEKHENTNLASEFYVLSMLYRKGLNAFLTLGNKKAVDIIIVKDNKTKTIDVKGIKEKSGAFPVDNCNVRKSNHFIIFVSFKDITNHELLEKNPEVYIVPSKDLDKSFEELKSYNSCKGKLVYSNPKGNRKVVNINRLREMYKQYKNKWKLLE